MLVEVLDDNREQLISQNMLEDGNSREEAEGVISLLLEFIGYFEDVSLNLKNQDERLAIQFELRVRD